MNRRILLALGAFVIWTAITVIVGRLRAGGGETADPQTARTALQMLAPVLLVLPNALYALWLLRHVGRTHAQPED